MHTAQSSNSENWHSYIVGRIANIFFLVLKHGIHIKHDKLMTVHSKANEMFVKNEQYKEND